MERQLCRNRDACAAKTAGKHCPPCTLSAKWADPEFREKRRQAYVARLQNDPEFRALHNRASADRLRQWRAQPGNKPGANDNSRANLAKANTPEGIAARREIVRTQRLGWCPPHRRDEYIRLARRMPAAEARRIILDDEQAQARRVVENNRVAMLQKHERELAQRY